MMKGTLKLTQKYVQLRIILPNGALRVKKCRTIRLNFIWMAQRYVKLPYIYTKAGTGQMTLMYMRALNGLPHTGEKESILKVKC